MFRFSFGWGLVAVALFTGCSGLAEKERFVKLQRSVERYASDIRWGRYDAAVGHIAKKNSKPITFDPKQFEEIRVTGYETSTGQLKNDNERASITVTFTFYDTDSGRLQTLADVQHWWYDDSRGRWFLDGDLPEFF